jgi:hypothetical protein
MPEARVVQAVGVAVGLRNGQPQTSLELALEKAMSEAVTKALLEGIGDPDVMRSRVIAARDEVLNRPSEGSNG